MIDKWFRLIKLPISIDQLLCLPRNAAYKYEYIAGEAWLTPRPKSYHALLDLRTFRPPISSSVRRAVLIRPLADDDWQKLPEVFAAAFDLVQPFASLDDKTRLEAAAECLEGTRNGEEGPLIPSACRVAIGHDDRRDEDFFAGAALVTLTSDVDLSDWRPKRWKELPADAVTRGIGRPHLTWIFVAPLDARYGIGAALLAGVADALTELGYTELASTFLLGNESSTLWHWRMGFRLASWPYSMRVIEERIEEREA